MPWMISRSTSPRKQSFLIDKSDCPMAGPGRSSAALGTFGIGIFDDAQTHVIALREVLMPRQATDGASLGDQKRCGEPCYGRMYAHRWQNGRADPPISRFDRGKFSYESRGHAAWGLVQAHQAVYRVADAFTPETVELASTARIAARSRRVPASSRASQPGRRRTRTR